MVSDNQGSFAQARRGFFMNWYWRNCRDIGFSIRFRPLTWRFGFERDADVYGGEWRLQLGPVMLVLSANIGNCSSSNRFEAWRGLSEMEAEERAERYAGRSALAQSEEGK
jgi:hypothetical protein